jgi:hypothetical protein
VPAVAAIGVDDDLAAGQAAVAVRAADHEAPGRIDVVDRAVVEILGRDHRLNDLLDDPFPDLLLGDLGVVLSGDHHGADAHRLLAVVLDADLRLAVRTQPGELPGAARGGQPAGQTVRELDRHRHQLRGLAAGEAEHQTLVAGAAGVDPLGDVGRLPVDGQHDLAAAAVELELGTVVADLLDDAARHAHEIDLRVGGDLAGEDDQVGGHQRFTGDAPGRILGQDLVQDGVGDLICHLVRMTFGHRLGCEQVGFVLAHRRTSGIFCGKSLA